mmetsp:Transcript_88490/g.245800  ORF Transcript_88490/g.245800 Transcript_88490/m.245800 type:complete len:217 (+) Transcript_88490:1310-1960(+)
MRMELPMTARIQNISNALEKTTLWSKDILLHLSASISHGSLWDVPAPLASCTCCRLFSDVQLEFTLFRPFMLVGEGSRALYDGEGQPGLYDGAAAQGLCDAVAPQGLDDGVALTAFPLDGEVWVGPTLSAGWLSCMNRFGATSFAPSSACDGALPAFKMGRRSLSVPGSGTNVSPWGTGSGPESKRSFSRLTSSTTCSCNCSSACPTAAWTSAVNN